MYYIGIDVSKCKHDCCILNTTGEMMERPFTFQNNQEGFDTLLSKIHKIVPENEKIKVGLEATGHYSSNITRFLQDKTFQLFILNPLHTNLYRQSLTLRKTKTDAIDSRVIATMLMSNPGLQPYSPTSYHMQELKSLTRYKSTKIKERSKLKSSLKRLVNILFPELESVVMTHNSSTYAILETYPSVEKIANANITTLTKLLTKASRGRLGREKAAQIHQAAKSSIGTISAAKSLELKHTIASIGRLNTEIKEITKEIKPLFAQLDTPITSIPGIGDATAASILAEVGDFSNFSSADKILAFAGMSPSTYQSGKSCAAPGRMEKRGSPYLRQALYNAAKSVCNHNPVFTAYLAQKRSQGKHYNIALSHVAKKLLRLMFALQRSGQLFLKSA